MRRAIDADELLDGPLDDPATLTGNLRDLARANRWLGGSSLSWRAIDAIVGEADPVSVLDVGTGRADIPLALIERAREAGRQWRFTAVDRRPEVLAAAALADRRLTATSELTLHVADGRSLPFPDGTFDVAHASLVVHHLDEDDAIRLLAEMRRVARLGVVVNDLLRGRLTWLGVWAWSHGFTRNRYTRNDASLSVARSYSRTELADLLEAAGLTIHGAFVGSFGHRWAVAARPVTRLDSAPVTTPG